MIVRCGFDAAPVAHGLRSLKNTVSEFGTSLANSWKSAMSGLWAPLTGAGIFLTLQKALDRIEAIGTQSQGFGISKGFLQDVQNLGRAAHLNEQAIENMFATFVKGLPAGADVEQEFYRMADRLAGIQDPATKAQVAIDAFGKAGIKMISIAGQGSEELKKMAAGFAKFSEDDIRRLERAKRAIERTENRGTILTGEALANADRLARGLKLMAYGFTGEEAGTIVAHRENVANRQSQRAEQQVKLAAAQTASIVEQQEALEAIDRLEERIHQKTFKQADLATQIKMLEAERQGFDGAAAFAASEEDAYDMLFEAVELEEKILELKKKQVAETDRQAEKQSQLNKDIAEQSKRVGDLQQRLAEAHRSPAQFGVAELATMANPAGAQARTVMALRNFARMNAMNWNIGLAEKQLGIADQIFSGLAKSNPFLEDPGAQVRRELEKQTQELGTLRSLATGAGLNINPKMGE